MSIFKESKFLAKHTVIYGIGNLSGYMATILLLPLYTRYLTPEDYGIKELIGLTTDVIGILTVTAISAAIYRYYFEYNDPKDKYEVLSSAFISSGAVGFAVMLILISISGILAKYILDSEKLYLYFYISFMTMWFQIMNEIANNYMRAEQQSVKFIIISFSKLVLAIALNVYFIVYLKKGVLGIFLTGLIVSILTFFFVALPIIWKVGWNFSWSKTKEMFRFGLPVVPAQLGGYIVHLSDRFFIKHYLSISDTGIYSLGYRFGTLPGNLISSPFNQIWLPRRFELYKKPDSEVLFGKIFTYFLFLMFFVGLTVAVLVKDILILIADRRYWSAYQIVPIIILANIIFSMHYHLNMGILIKKKTIYLAYINFSNGILNLILNIFLIKYYGLYGAAYATLASFVYKVGLTYYCSSKYYKIYFEYNRMLKMLVAAILVYLIAQGVDSSDNYLRITIKLGVICLFPMILYALKFYSKNELSGIMNYMKHRTLQANNQAVKP